MTGFPGESQQSFENTLSFIKAINPNWSGCFTYSREEDTPAYSFKNRVPAKLAKERAQKIEELQSHLTAEHTKKYVSKSFTVLVEEIIAADEKNNEDNEGLALGRAWFMAPEVDGSVVIRYDLDSKEEKAAVKPGKLVKVLCLASTGVDLDCRFIEKL